MINNFKFLNTNYLKDIILLRNGEIKLGEKCVFANDQNFKDILNNDDIKFVLFGISEDIGVQANFGKKGTKEMFQSFLKTFLNIQYNSFNNFSNLAILGDFQFNEFQEEIENLNLKIPKNRQRLFEMVDHIDQEVSKLCFKLIRHKKIPIVVGGGHNNCYGIIKGLSLGLTTPINVINMDTHSDYRILEGRHSGNGFSYAKHDSYLDKYCILGLQENYTSKDVLDKLKKNKTILTYTFEDLYIREKYKMNEIYEKINTFFENKNFGIEIDLDCIPNIMSSAFTPEGIALKDIRKILYHLQKNKKPLYLHICEGIPDINYPSHTEKTMAYIVSDFIKNNQS